MVALLLGTAICGTAAWAQQKPGKLAGRRPVAANGQADLIVRDFERTAALRYKDGNLEIPVTFFVNNRGDAGTGIKFVNSVRVDGKDRWTGFMDAVSADSYKTATAVVKIADPNKLLAGRTLHLEAYADAPIAAADTSMPAWGRVQEESENNNKASLNVVVPGGLDLKAEQTAPTRVPTRIGKVKK